MEKINFRERVYALCRRIPRGRVTTYRELGHALGIKGYRAIGQALRCNPHAPRVPCHRVVCYDGHIGGFKGAREGKEIKEKIKLLEGEGVKVRNGVADLKLYFFKL